METIPASSAPASQPGLSTKKILLIILGVVLLTAGLAVGGTFWWVKHNFDPAPMKPVVLTEKERTDFDSKLALFGDPPMAPVMVNMPVNSGQPPPPTTPPKIEPGAENRTIIITEREVNAYLAKQNLGEYVQLSFSEGKIKSPRAEPLRARLAARPRHVANPSSAPWGAAGGSSPFASPFAIDAFAFAKMRDSERVVMVLHVGLEGPALVAVPPGVRTEMVELSGTLSGIVTRIRVGSTEVTSAGTAPKRTSGLPKKPVPFRVRV